MCTTVQGSQCAVSFHASDVIYSLQRHTNYYHHGLSQSKYFFPLLYRRSTQVKNNQIIKELHHTFITAEVPKPRVPSGPRTECVRAPTVTILTVSNCTAASFLMCLKCLCLWGGRGKKRNIRYLQIKLTCTGRAVGFFFSTSKQQMLKFCCQLTKTQIVLN